MKLKSIQIKFNGTYTLSVEEYLKRCKDNGYTPTQDGYKTSVLETYRQNLLKIVGENIEYSDEKEYEFLMDT